MRRALATAGLLGFSLIATVAIGEVALRRWLPNPDGFYVFPPGLEREFAPLETLMPGVSGVSRFAVDALGLRGDELDSRDTWRILAVGGSTTQCLYLDQQEAWPYRLQILLQERSPAGERVWVGNAGKAGRRLPEYLVQLEHLLDEVPDLDVVVMLVGANDVNRRLNEGDEFHPADVMDPEVRRALLPRAFDVHPAEYALWPPTRSAIGGLVVGAWRTFEIRRHWQLIQDRRGGNYEIWRQRRREASEIRDALPDLGVALRSYAKDLGLAASLARERGVRLVLMTQPYVYRPDLPDEIRRLLWMGWIGERQSDRAQVYYSVSALARAYDAYNDTLRRFCKRARAECIDLEPQLPKDIRSFYDDIHFNEGGSERVARIVADYLLGHPRPGAGGAGRAAD